MFHSKDTALNYSSSPANWCIAVDSFPEKQMSRHIKIFSLGTGDVMV